MLSQDSSHFSFSDSVLADARQRALLFLNGMISGRERLLSGEYIAVGRVSGTRSDAPPLNGEVSLYSVFDFQTQRLRFDRRETRYVETLLSRKTELGQPPTKATTRKVLLQPIEGRCVVDPERWVDWNDNAPAEVRIYPRTASWAGGIARPFDIRILSLGLLFSMDKQTPFSELMSIYSRQDIINVAMDTDNVCCITWKLGTEGRGRRILWIDQSVGYSPVRLEIHDLGQLDKPPALSTLSTRASCTWLEKERVWVPTSFVIEGEMETSEPRKYELSFDWMKVNQPVDSGKFSPEGLKIENYARVMDVRGEFPVLVDELNGPSPLAPPVTIPDNKQSSFPFLMINLGIVVIITALVIAWRIKYSFNRQK